MMMNRERLGFWVRLVAILLAAVFLISFIFLGVGTNIQYNIFDLFGNQDQPNQQQDQTPGPEQQIAAAEKDLKKDPKDPEKIKDLAYLYYTAGRYDEAIQVLQKGQEAVPERRGDTGASGPDLQPAGADRDGEEEGRARGQGGGRLRGLGRGAARQRGGVPSGGPGLRPGRTARRGHQVLQPVPRPRSQWPGRGQSQGQDFRASRRQGEHR